jgi:hypothetical protein
MARSNIPKNGITIKFKGKRPLEWPRTRRFSQVLEDIKRRRRSWQEIKMKRQWEERRAWDFSSADLLDFNSSHLMKTWHLEKHSAVQHSESNNFQIQRK